jgi:hypothetical protein
MISLEAEEQAVLFEAIEIIKRESATRLELLGKLIDARNRALEVDTPEAWIEASKIAQRVIEHSRLNSVEFMPACRLKELAGRRAGLTLL